MFLGGSFHRKHRQILPAACSPASILSRCEQTKHSILIKDLGNSPSQNRLPEAPQSCPEGL
jgi:hypothetical protein